MKHSFLAILSTSMFLTACGGGGNPAAPDYNSTANAAIPGIAANVPVSKPFTGAFMLIEGQSVGYVAATSPRAAVELVTRVVMADVVKFAPWYQAMLSDKGMKVEVVGEASGKSSITGATLYAPNMVFVVKVTANNVVVISGW